MTATVDLAASQPERGQNHFWLSFKPETASVEVTAVSATLSGTSEVIAGTVDSNQSPISVMLDLPMSGEWDVTVELTVDGALDTLSFPLEVK